jgi:hypothetical protein
VSPARGGINALLGLWRRRDHDFRRRMCGAERYPSLQFREMIGFAKDQPIYALHGQTCHGAWDCSVMLGQVMEDEDQEYNRDGCDDRGETFGAYGNSEKLHFQLG